MASFNYFDYNKKKKKNCFYKKGNIRNAYHNKIHQPLYLKSLYVHARHIHCVAIKLLTFLSLMTF